MRMPGKTSPVVVRIVGAEMVQQKEGIKRLLPPEPEYPLKVNSSPFDGRCRTGGLPDLSQFAHVVSSNVLYE
jgi:hypothetical protein